MRGGCVKKTYVYLVDVDIMGLEQCFYNIYVTFIRRSDQCSRFFLTLLKVVDKNIILYT